MVAPLLRDYYARPGNELGGSLHIVIEDGNIEDWCVSACVDGATERGDTVGQAIGLLLLAMSTTQRRKLSAMSFYSWVPA